MKHPSEIDLALFAGNESGRFLRFLMGRHLRECRECAAKVARFEMLRAEMLRAEMGAPALDLDWARLESEMRANIRVGLEAGECVRLIPEPRKFNSRLGLAFASLLILVGAAVLMKSGPVPPVAVATAPASTASEPVLESTGDGVELRSGASSLTLTNHHGAVAEQTVSAGGEIRARYVEGGSVTITSASF